MELDAAITTLASLAQETCLAIFRLLVENAAEELTAGVIGEQLRLPAPTLSFHLKTLTHAGLVSATQEGRFLRYRADRKSINDLVRFMTENCCGGHPESCAPESK